MIAGSAFDGLLRILHPNVYPAIHQAHSLDIGPGNADSVRIVSVYNK